MAYADRTPVDIIVNGTRSGLLPSPPSTVSSVTTPKQRPISPPGTPPQSPKSGKTNRHQPQHRRAAPLPQSTVLSPRPVQELLVERSYLVDSLAAQGARASELIRRLAAAEQAAATAPDARRRRLRKQVSLLRSKVAAAAGQEKAVIVSLGELYVEMQSRERWARARTESFEQGYFPIMPPEGPAPGACLGGWEPAGMPMSVSMVLSPESPEFVPGWARRENPWPMPDVPNPQEQ